MRVLAIVATAMVLVGCAGLQSPGVPMTGIAQGSEARFQEGRRHFDAGRYGLALVAFRTALSTQPDHLRALNGAAAAYDVMGRYDLADRYYQEALALNPDSPQTLNNVAYSHMLRGEFAVAGTYLDWARESAVSASQQVEATIAGNLARLRGHNGAALASNADEGAPAPLVRVIESQMSQGWIERHSETVLYLVLAPEPELNERIRALGVAPQYASYMPGWSDRALTPSELLVRPPEPVTARPARDRDQATTGNALATPERFTAAVPDPVTPPWLKLDLSPLAADAGPPDSVPLQIDESLANAVAEDPSVAQGLPPLILHLPAPIPASVSVSRLSSPPDAYPGSIAEPRFFSTAAAAATAIIDHRSVPVGPGRIAVGRSQTQV